MCNLPCILNSAAKEYAVLSSAAKEYCREVSLPNIPLSPEHYRLQVPVISTTTSPFLVRKMKFTSIAVASVAYMAASASAFSWGCQEEHFYGARDIAGDIGKIKSAWNKPNSIYKTLTRGGTWLHVECTPLPNHSSSVTLQDCSDALDWLWNKVNSPDGDYLDKKGLIPRTCTVDNESLVIKWY
ncbi:hypothetical protein BGZ89_004430 [Linnemannia elongata]|nr:hypothetical protein BGZ89_004430 [Linnemannia elongata]